MREEGTVPKGEEEVVSTLLRLPELAEGEEDLRRRGRLLTVDCLIGTPRTPIYLSIGQGCVTAATRGPLLMRATRFSCRADPAAWAAHWEAMPKAGFHDLLALTKRGAASLEGDLHPFIAHLQYFKDLLALPRAAGGLR